MAEEGIRRKVWVNLNQWHDNITAIFEYDAQETEDTGEDWPPKELEQE